MPKFYSTFCIFYFCVSGHNQNTCYKLDVLFILLLFYFIANGIEKFSAIVSIKLFQCNQLMMTPLLTPYVCFLLLIIMYYIYFFDILILIQFSQM